MTRPRRPLVAACLCVLGCGRSGGASDLGQLPADVSTPSDLSRPSPLDSAGPITCRTGDDCPTGECTAGYCSVPWPCNDKLKDGQETDVDCGGPSAMPCANGRVCLADSDCWSRKCLGGKCGTKPALTLPGDLSDCAVYRDPDWCKNTSFADVGDLDGDGAPDVAATMVRLAMVDVFLNDGKGTLRLWQQPKLPWWGSRVAVADLDGDGRLDIAVAPDGFEGVLVPELAILWNEGNGAFSPATVTACVEPETQQLVVEDLDNDGRPDLAVTCQQAPMGDAEIGWLRNEGGRRFSFRAPILLTGPLASIQASWHTRVDLNGDCRPDFMIDGAGPGLPYALNLGNGSFTPEMFLPANLLPPGNYWASPRVWDFTGDGIPDILTPIEDENFVPGLYLAPGTGGGAFGKGGRIQLGPSRVTPGIPPVVLADIDQDGWMDAAANFFLDGELYQNQRNGTLAYWPGRVACFEDDANPVVADMNGDGKPDIVTVSAAGSVGILFDTAE